MRTLIQRVKKASVEIDGKTHSKIGEGLLVFVAIELKVGEFLPEYKGKMEFYLSVLNNKVKLPAETDSIGIIICKKKNRTVVEYSLKTPAQLACLPIPLLPYCQQVTGNFCPIKKNIAEKIEKYFDQS